jgi:hypothetical protein
MPTIFSKFRPGAWAFCLPVLLFASSCNRDGAPVKEYVLSENDEGFAQDFSQMEFLSANAENMADIAYSTSAANFNGCQPAITHDTNLNVIVIDFGAECKEADHLTRKGRIIINYTRNYFDSGSTKTILFDNYTYNNMRMTGYNIIENRGVGINGRIYFSIAIKDTLFMQGDAGYISRLSERSRTWIEGAGSPLSFADDVFDITGSGSLKRANNYYCDVNILDKLRMTGDCKYIRSGLMQTIPKDGDSRVINFGSGNCDDDATLDVKGKNFEIKL